MADTQCLERDIEYSGADLTPVPNIPNAMACLNECLKLTTTCVQWVYIGSTTTCFPKGANVNPPQPMDPGLGFIYGQIACSCFEPNKDVVAGTVVLIGQASISDDDVGECQARCARTPRCAGFTVNTADGKCWLWTGVASTGIQTQEAIGVIYGPAICN